MMEVLFALFLLAASFYLLAVITEEFFVPSIDAIAQRLKMGSDAAGATLLAMGSSAPEFFTAFFAITGLAGSGHGDVGAGTIVGSAIFNVLVIVGASAMFRAVKLQWQPVIRDQIFYSITIIMLLVAFMDGKIVLYEAIVFVLMYIVYVFTVIHWRKILNYEDIQATVDVEKKDRNALNAFTHRVLSLLIPDSTKRPKLMALSFTLCILAIAGLSWLLVNRVVFIADVFNINATFLALTVLAAGTSLPDLIGSIVVAKQGRGDMAVSNAIGSNIFDILFCLGFPWLLVIALKGEAITVGTENLFASVLLLFATVVSLLFMLIIRNWKIGHKAGLLLIGLYVAYAIYTIVTVA